MQVLSGDRVAFESGHDIKIWNLDDRTCIQTLEGHTEWVECLIVLSDETLVSGSQDRTIKLWNLSENTCIQTLHGLLFATAKKWPAWTHLRSVSY